MFSCGNMSKEEKNEMKNFEDSVKADNENVNSSVDAANDFLNNDSITLDTLAESK